MIFSTKFLRYLNINAVIKNVNHNLFEQHFQLMVNIEDINEFPPAFTMASFFKKDVPENAIIGQTVMSGNIHTLKSFKLKDISWFS